MKHNTIKTTKTQEASKQKEKELDYNDTWDCEICGRPTTQPSKLCIVCTRDEKEITPDKENQEVKPHKVNKIVRLSLQKRGWWTPGLKGYLPLNKLIPILVEEGAKPIIVCEPKHSIQVHEKMKEIAAQIGKFSYEVNKTKVKANAK